MTTRPPPHRPAELRKTGRDAHAAKSQSAMLVVPVETRRPSAQLAVVEEQIVTARSDEAADAGHNVVVAKRDAVFDNLNELRSGEKRRERVERDDIFAEVRLNTAEVNDKAFTNENPVVVIEAPTSTYSNVIAGPERSHRAVK